MQRLAPGYSGSIGLPGYFITESYRSPGQLNDARRDDQIVFIAGRRQIPAISFGDYHIQSGLLLHIAIRESAVNAELAAADFKPDQVIGVIGDAHLVGFSVSDLDT